jgi:hypothetical protein
MTTLTDHESNSMLIDVVMAVLLNMQPAAPPPPPAAYDHPYVNVRIIERKDLWMKYGAWAWTKQPRFLGDLCTIYYAPLGAWLKKDGVMYVLDPIAFEQMIRHEMGRS